MSEITLEKIDIIKERTGVSYTEAKEALEECDSDVVNALIYIEAKQKRNSKFNMEEMYSTKDEFVVAIKDIVRKGNVSRIKVKKDENVVMDIPVNAGIAAGLVGLFNPVIIGLGLLTAVLTKVTIEITKVDGTVEVVNTIIKNTVEDVKSRMSDMSFDVKEKLNDTKDTFTKISKDGSDENVYQYTVKFDKEKEDEEEKE
ncbi:DUF4342 domain-containing protein [Clostridium tagluense]|uniref:DUF4342 domain-containing protein n=1 Tax=Clostridium tagluense TaxID=360422 RepID=UPI001C6DE983|nr:DUF4342 domain-containing protein [Clostridium tagluense]MBW9155029.1 DUF4342 domain-containing protein [Clostridium tagluense]MCB2310098.1 DUF4342 domain-containing protein [Clostridium tagluense]MCB2314372.1 DUF4342 domain-containing protein [Clostridium tagluense]MCB2319218.1 DUF4342 domain-containing protein [Clostridium tagluense]MCB2324692.1 DUF4342 domain-containing protein [Clostridium tagluense]